MLEVKNLTVNYGAITALRGISLEVKQGDIVTLIGANGAGKTTTLRAISGSAKAQGAARLFMRAAISPEMPAHQIVKLGISHVPEGRMVFANLTVMENLMMGAYLQKDKNVIRRNWIMSSAFFRACTSAKSRWPARFRAANNRCWPSAAR